MRTVKKIAYVLKQSLRKKGSAGDVVLVTRGFGRYLESQNIAQRGTQDLLQDLESKKQLWQKQEEGLIAQAQKLLDQIKGKHVVLKKRIAHGDKLYESVRPENIVAAFKSYGINLENKHIKLNKHIKTLGMHNVIIHLYGNCETEIELEVIAEDTI
jgi:large subunit ribosomal protein L9